ncbi:MAG: hypothetical protein ACP5PB_08625, partial [Acidimicrobiales bacterium]
RGARRGARRGVVGVVTWVWFAATAVDPIGSVHRGVPLPAARVVVIAVPVTFLLVFAWLRRRS